MSGKDISGGSSNKISLALLKGRSAGQSVPSISFRFNTTDENITQVSDTEDGTAEENEIQNEKTVTVPSFQNSLEPTTESSPVIAHTEIKRDSSPSPVKDYLRSFGRRSSSLDSPDPQKAEPPKPIETSKSSDPTGSLFSRLTNAFEEKINEIRKEKLEREEKEKEVKENEKRDRETGDSDSSKSSVSIEKSYNTKDKNISESERTSSEEKDSISGSPPKKTTIAQDITEHTSRFKAELNTIRPKLSELRQRRTSKDNISKSRPFVFTSLLGRDEGLGEEMLLECDEGEVDRAVEAEEDTVCDLIDGSNYNESLIPDTECDQNTQTLRGAQPQLLEDTKENKCFSTIHYIKEHYTKLANKLPISISRLSKISLILVFICFIMPFPRFLAGFILGMVVSSLCCYWLVQMLHPRPPEPLHLDQGQPVIMELPAYEDKQVHQGWMNEMEYYTPETYHVSDTHSVFVRLQGSKLKIDHPRGKIPKHGRSKEEIHNTVFLNHREYNIAGCEVQLYPQNLPRRWLWSRKYPICIRLKGGDTSPSPDSVRSTPCSSAHGSPFHVAATTAPVGESGVESGDGNWSLHNNKSGSTEESAEDLMNTSLDMASFEEITTEMCTEKSLFFFARTDREKDDWFRRLIAASEISSKSNNSPSHQQVSKPSDSSALVEKVTELFQDSTAPVASTGEQQKTQTSSEPSSTPLDMRFESYMARLLYQPLIPAASTAAPVEEGEKTEDEGGLHVTWINALVGRIFYDFLKDPYWANKVQERVQRKLSKIHVPYYVGELVVCGVDLGSSIPHLKNVKSPKVDPRGLWMDMDVEYTGNFTLSLETKLDLMKLKEQGGKTGVGSSSSANISVPSAPSTGTSSSEAIPISHNHSNLHHSRSYSRSPTADLLPRNLHFDTDTDDSIESSSDSESEDEERAQAGVPVGGSGPASRRLMRIVDSVAASKYFQHASEWRLLQKALQGVSNTRIELSVEVRKLSGLLTVNVPPPPADRLWYGFRGTPELVMVVRPRLGDHVVSLHILVEFIQKQIKTIFEKVFVLPNMDDLVIPIMSPILPGQHQVPRPPWEMAQTNIPTSTSTCSNTSETTNTTTTTVVTTNSTVSISDRATAPPTATPSVVSSSTSSSSSINAPKLATPKFTMSAGIV